MRVALRCWIARRHAKENCANSGTPCCGTGALIAFILLVHRGDAASCLRHVRVGEVDTGLAAGCDELVVVRDIAMDSSMVTLASSSMGDTASVGGREGRLRSRWTEFHRAAKYKKEVRCKRAIYTTNTFARPHLALGAGTGTGVTDSVSDRPTFKRLFFRAFAPTTPQRTPRGPTPQ